MLSFNDEQLIAVGLKVPPIDLLGTLLTTVMGKPQPVPDVEVSLFMKIIYVCKNNNNAVPYRATILRSNGSTS